MRCGLPLFALMLFGSLGFADEMSPRFRLLQETVRRLRDPDLDGVDDLDMVVIPEHHGQPGNFELLYHAWAGAAQGGGVTHVYVEKHGRPEDVRKLDRQWPALANKPEIAWQLTNIKTKQDPGLHPRKLKLLEDLLARKGTQLFRMDFGVVGRDDISRSIDDTDFTIANAGSRHWLSTYHSVNTVLFPISGKLEPIPHPNLRVPKVTIEHQKKIVGGYEAARQAGQRVLVAAMSAAILVEPGDRDRFMKAFSHSIFAEIPITDALNVTLLVAPGGLPTVRQLAAQYPDAFFYECGNVPDCDPPGAAGHARRGEL